MRFEMSFLTTSFSAISLSSKSTSSFAPLMVSLSLPFSFSFMRAGMAKSRRELVFESERKFCSSFSQIPSLSSTLSQPAVSISLSSALVIAT